MTEQSTKIAYYIGDENTPYVIKVRVWFYWNKI